MEGSSIACGGKLEGAARRRARGSLRLVRRGETNLADVREDLGDERGRVEHEANTLISELRRAGEAMHLLQRLAECLDDDVLLTDEPIDDEADTAIGDARDDDVALRARAGAHGRRLRRLCVLVEP